MFKFYKYKNLIKIIIDTGPEYFLLDKGEKVDKNEANLQRGQSHVYPYNFGDPQGPKRTVENYTSDLKEFTLHNKEKNGVKGICTLSKLKYFCPIRSTCIDYMHSLCEGVIKNFFNYWFEAGDFLGEHSLRKYMQEI